MLDILKHVIDYVTRTWKCWIRWVSCLMGKWNIFKEIFWERRLFGIQCSLKVNTSSLEKSCCEIQAISLCSCPAALLSGGRTVMTATFTSTHVSGCVSLPGAFSTELGGWGGSVLLFSNAIFCFIITNCHHRDERDLGTANLIRLQTRLRMCLYISPFRRISCGASWFSRNISLRKHALWFLFLKLHFIFISSIKYWVSFWSSPCIEYSWYSHTVTSMVFCWFKVIAAKTSYILTIFNRY